MPGPQSFGPAHEYLVDAWQRSILFLDVLRQPGPAGPRHAFGRLSGPDRVRFAAEDLLPGVPSGPQRRPDPIRDLGVNPRVTHVHILCAARVGSYLPFFFFLVG